MNNDSPTKRTKEDVNEKLSSDDLNVIEEGLSELEESDMNTGSIMDLIEDEIATQKINNISTTQSGSEHA